MADDKTETPELGLDADADSGRSNRMMLVFGLVGGLAVGGGGVFVGLKYFAGDNAGQVVVEEVAEEEEEAPANPTLDIVYLEVERMPAPVVDSRGDLMGYVFLDLSLEITGGGPNQSFVSERLPRVKDAFIRAISREGLTKEGTNGEIDFDRVSAYLTVTANQAVGQNYVSNVFITRALRAPN